MGRRYIALDADTALNNNLIPDPFSRELRLSGLLKLHSKTYVSVIGFSDL